MSSSSGTIYTGPWVNWSHGLIVGSTLTLSARDGQLLTAFIATFITIVGASLWTILSYTFHQMRASRTGTDGLHHQQQNIFRNTSSPAGAAITFIKQAFFWRKSAKRPYLRTLPWAFFAIVYICLFGVLSVFSAQTSKAAGDERLIRGTSCGYWRMADQVTLQSQTAFTRKTTRDTLLAANYARACYSETPDPLQCNVYPVKDIPWTKNQNATCPFTSGTCVYGDTAAFQMDTGLIDSHQFLGINAPTSQRLQYRKVSTCAPLHVLKYAKAVNGSVRNGGMDSDTIIQLFYGSLQLTELGLQNWTHSWNMHTSLDDVGYTVSTLLGIADFFGGWTPIPDVNRTDADVSLVFLEPNAMRFEEPNDDPVFGASESLNITSSTGELDVWYTPDWVTSVIGCADQHQFCNPNNGQCTPLSGTQALVKNSLKTAISLDVWQQTTVVRIAAQAQFSDIYHAIWSRGASALRALETVTQLQQGPISSTQWMTEVAGWFDTGLARIQQGITEYATGPTDVLPGSEIWLPTDLASRAMSYSQKVSDTRGTISFSILGIAITFIVGGLIIVTSLAIDTFVGFLQTKVIKKGQYKRLNWILDDKFQLQRMIFEEAKMGTWEGATDSIPTTHFGEVFGGWQDVDEEHPRLKRMTSQVAKPPGSSGSSLDSDLPASMPEKEPGVVVHEVQV